MNISSLMNRKSILIAGILLLVVLAVGLFSQRINLANKQSYLTNKTPVLILKQENQDFAAAQSAQQEGNYSLALQSYQKALSSAKDSVQKAQIEYLIAGTNELLGNFVQAIDQFKKIAADPSNSPQQRAYAVQELGFMYYTYRDQQPLLVKETFKDAPYDSFLKNNDIDLAYRHLFEYAASLYPLAYSEARIAYWYSNDVLTRLHGVTTSDEAIAEISVAKQSIEKADANLQALQADPTTDKARWPSILAREGRAVAHLATLGAANMQQAESYLSKAVQTAPTVGIPAGNYFAYDYAAVLANKYGSKRSADITKLLSPFKEGNDANLVVGISKLFAAARTDPTLSVVKNSLVRLGQIDPDFKTYLISLGWHAADFQ
jgi:tetratricopeptide (TPR) repeat protein